MRPIVSIIMSVYNEDQNHLIESIQSILDQTLSDFEFIIINDNPSNILLENVINSFHDDRIKLFRNEVNIGLALSMNRAAELATTDCLVRMDADDIAEKDRIARQYEYYLKGYDLLFSRYSFIDESSNPINENKAENQSIYSPDEISKIIQLKNIIHHPTVMMRKELLFAVGGYRNFPCSQDYDLWLRIAEFGCRFYMLEQSLLKYRINSNSVSSKKWYLQQLTAHYIFQMSYERLKHKKDSFSEDSYQRYLTKFKSDDDKSSSIYKSQILKLDKAYEIKSRGSSIGAWYMIITTILCTRLLRLHYVLLIKKYFLLKYRKKL